LEAVAVLVAVMGVAGALLALVIDESASWALAIFGATSGQIRRMSSLKRDLLALLANAAGVALGFALSLILVFASTAIVRWNDRSIARCHLSERFR